MTTTTTTTTEGTTTMDTARERLEYLRQQLRAERISYGELAELASLADFIQPGDVELAEAAGIPEDRFTMRRPTGDAITDDDLARAYDHLVRNLPDNVRGTLADDSGSGDEWGWAMAHRFGIAEALSWHGEEIPAEWDFRPAGGGPHPCEEYPDCEWAAGLELGTMTGDGLRAAGDALSAYAELLRAAGRDY